MSKFTKQYTTKEQSEKLLKLGIPAWTADCYYDNHNFNSPAFIDNIGYDSFDELLDYVDYPNEVTPCWTTGRLIEIFNVCNEYLDLVELSTDPGEMIKEIDTAIMDEVWDWDKLEEYKNE